MNVGFGVFGGLGREDKRGVVKSGQYCFEERGGTANGGKMRCRIYGY